MQTSNWTTQLLTGSQIPTPRTGHTTTLGKNSNSFFFNM